MTTARDICTRAIQVIGVTGLGRTPSDRQISTALSHFNEMMHGLNTRGAVIEWSDVGLSDTVPFESDIEDLVIHALANRLQVPMGQFPTDRDLQRRLVSAEPRLAGHYRPERPYDSGYF